MISSTKNGREVFHVVGKVLLWIRIAVRYFLGCFCKSACAICLVIVNSGLWAVLYSVLKFLLKKNCASSKMRSVLEIEW